MTDEDSSLSSGIREHDEEAGAVSSTAAAVSASATMAGQEAGLESSIAVLEASEGVKAVLFVTATRAEFLADPRIILNEIEAVQTFAQQKGWSLVDASNMELPGVFFHPAVSNKINQPLSLSGFRDAFNTDAEIIVVSSFGRVAPSLSKLASFLETMLVKGKRLAAVQDGIVLDANWLKRIREIIPLQHQTHGGRMRAARAASKLPGRPVKGVGRLPAYETATEIDGASVRVPNFAVLRELARADELKATGLGWGKVADQLEEELAKAEGRPPLDDEPTSVDRYIRKCGRALHSADWNFRKFIEEHSFNRPVGKISRRWSRVRLLRILHTQRPQLDEWLKQRGMSLAAFLTDSKSDKAESNGGSHVTRAVRDSA